MWSYAGVCFSRYGTLLATAEACVKQSPQGYFAQQLAQALQVEVQDALRQLVGRKTISRQLVSGRYLYTCSEPATRQRQWLTRRRVQAVPTVPDAARLEVSPDELPAAILLFYSLLDEKQRRLYAAIESLQLGHGGERQLAEFLGLDPHTVARGRRQLLEGAVEAGRVRKVGWGRKPLKNNAHMSASHRDSAGARHRRRCHQRSALDAPDAPQDGAPARTNRYRGLGQHRGSSAAPDELLLGVSHDPPCLAAPSIAPWWRREGVERYARAAQLLILAETGGSKGCRCRAWKTNPPGPTLQLLPAHRDGGPLSPRQLPMECRRASPVLRDPESIPSWPSIHLSIYLVDTTLVDREVNRKWSGLLGFVTTECLTKSWAIRSV